MNRPLVAIFATLAVLAPAAAAQEIFTFETDFHTGQVYRYELTSTSRVEGSEEATTTTEIEYAYEIEHADESGFIVHARIDRFAIETGEGRFVYPESELPVPLQPLFRLLGALEAVRFEYDRRWNLIHVHGLGKVIGRLLRPLPEPLSDLGRELGRALESVLGPLATAALEDSNRDDLTFQLFSQGSAMAGTSSASETSGLLGSERQSWRVTELATEHDRPVCRVETTRKLTFGDVPRLLGYGLQTTSGTISLFSNGLPSWARLETRFEFQGRRLVTVMETKLAPEEAQQPDDVWARIRPACDREDYEGALEIVDGMLLAEPENAQAFLARAVVLDARGYQVAEEGLTSPESARLFVEAGAAYRRHRELAGAQADRERGALIFYDEACGRAIGGQADQAMESLRLAVEAGWDDADHLAADPDLETLRDREDYNALVEEMRAK